MVFRTAGLARERDKARRKCGKDLPTPGMASKTQGALDHERTVLADYGNMSAPTALFVLERLI
jgi:hypothetical protein